MSYAHAWMQDNGLRPHVPGDMVLWSGLDLNAPRRLATKAKVHFAHLVAPEFPGYWCPVGLQQALDVFRWMVQSADGDGDGVYPLLSCQPTCRGFDGVRPLIHAPQRQGGPRSWKQDLARRFHYALLSWAAAPSAWHWRRANRIEVGQSRIVPMRYYVSEEPGLLPDASLEKLVDSVFAWSGRDLADAANPSHPEARRIFSVGIKVRPDGYELRLSYGYGADPSSSWPIVLRDRANEPFLDFIIRSKSEFEPRLAPVPAANGPGKVLTHD